MGPSGGIHPERVAASAEYRSRPIFSEMVSFLRKRRNPLIVHYW